MYVRALSRLVVVVWASRHGLCMLCCCSITVPKEQEREPSSIPLRLLAVQFALPPTHDALHALFWLYHSLLMDWTTAVTIHSPAATLCRTMTTVLIKLILVFLCLAASNSCFACIIYVCKNTMCMEVYTSACMHYICMQK